MKKILLFFFIITILFSANLVASGPKCSQNGTNLIYINGASTIRSKADETMDRLKVLAEKSYIDSEADVTFILSHNSTAGKLKDYLETITQKAAEFGLSSTEAYVLLFRAVTGIPKLGPYIGISTVIVENIWNLADPSYVTLTESMQQQTQDTIELRNKIVSSMFDNKKTIVVSHSQGGLFSNSAYDQLVNFNPYVGENRYFEDVEKLIGNLQIATPAPFSHFLKQRHMTNDKDLILKIPGSWRSDLYPFNVGTSIDPRSEDEKKQNHGITDTYLADYDEENENDPFDGLREELLDKLYQVAEDLDSNCGVPPVAQFAPPKSRAYAPINPDPMTYNFDGSSSFNPDPTIDIVSFDWLVDGFILISGSNPLYTFLTEGLHTVQLIVTDSEGSKSEPNIMQINVVNRAPFPDFTTSLQGLSVSFDATSSFDDGRIVSFLWDYGDGSTGSGMTSSHVYAAEDTYLVTLTVTDNNGKTNSTSSSVTVANRCDGQTGQLIGNVFIANSATVNTTGSLSGKIDICGSASVTGNVSILSNSLIKITGNAKVTDNAFIQTAVGAKVTIDGDSIVKGTVRLFSRYTLNITDNVIVDGGAKVLVNQTGGFGSDGEITIKGNSQILGSSNIETVAFNGHKATISIEDAIIFGRISAYAVEGNASVIIEGPLTICADYFVDATDTGIFINSTPESCQ